MYDPFKVYRGFTQGKPRYPTIFNMVVDAVIRHWEIVVAVEEAGPEILWRVVHTLAALFYADYKILASPRPSRLQEALDVLIGLFNRFGLRMNVNNTVGMI